MSQTTNDSQAEYGNGVIRCDAIGCKDGRLQSGACCSVCSGTGRKPLLSDEKITSMCQTAYDYTMAWLAMEKARKFYEAMITSGELKTKAEHKRLVIQAILDHESNQQGTW